MRKFFERYMLILGSYSFAVPIVSLVHEFGHILAYWSIGFTQFRLKINPFTTSAAEPLVPLPSEYMLYLATAGMAFQLLFFTVSGITLNKTKSPLLAPIKMCLPLSMLNIGSYLLATGFEGGDSAIMVLNGVPPLLLNILGVIGVALGLVSFTHHLTNLGFSSKEPLREVFTPLFLGIETYSMLMLGYAVLTGYDLMIGKTNVVTSVLLSGIIIALFKGMDLKAVSIPKRGIAFQVLGMGIIAVCLSLIF